MSRTSAFTAPIVENHMETNMEDEMEARASYGVYRDTLGGPPDPVIVV